MSILRGAGCATVALSGLAAGSVMALSAWLSYGAFQAPGGPEVGGVLAGVACGQPILPLLALLAWWRKHEIVATGLAVLCLALVAVFYTLLPAVVFGLANP